MKVFSGFSQSPVMTFRCGGVEGTIAGWAVGEVTGDVGLMSALSHDHVRWVDRRTGAGDEP